MYASWSITIFPSRWRAITKRRDVPDVTVVKVSVWPSIQIRTCRNWINLWRVSPWLNRISVDNCSLRQQPMPKHPSAAERCCSTISVRIIQRTIAATAITVCIPRRRSKHRMSWFLHWTPSWLSRRISVQITSLISSLVRRQMRSLLTTIRIWNSLVVALTVTTRYGILLSVRRLLLVIWRKR